MFRCVVWLNPTSENVQSCVNFMKVTLSMSGSSDIVTTAPVTILYVVFLVSSNHRSHDTVNIALLIFTLGTNFNISFFPEEYGDNFKCVISQQSIIISIVSISSEMSPKRIPQLDFIYHKSTLAKVMTWCRRATSHWFNHCWPRFISPNGITRRQ